MGYLFSFNIMWINHPALPTRGLFVSSEISSRLVWKEGRMKGTSLCFNCLWRITSWIWCKCRYSQKKMQKSLMEITVPYGIRGRNTISDYRYNKWKAGQLGSKSWAVVVLTEILHSQCLCCNDACLALNKVKIIFVCD